MMKYMDSIITEQEATELRSHIEECEICKEDFIMYNHILEEFSNIDNIIEAPDDFELQVMAKIDKLEPIYIDCETKSESLLCALWGSFSVFAGIGTILIINKEAITNFIMKNPNFSAYADMLIPVENYVEQFKVSLASIFTSLIESTSGYITSLKYVSLIAFILLMVAQYIIYKKDKVEYNE